MQVAPAASAASVSIEQFDVVSVGLLSESPRNARKYFDPAKLAELVESVKQHGVVSPLLVREMKEPGRATFLEIIDGARRYRAAVDAGLAALPARIVTCSDQEAMELGAISNLQREDIHPLDEALGFRALIEMSGMEVATVAAKVGKSESYVYQRLKLSDLCQQARELLWADEISIGVATLLAKVSHEYQQEALRDEWPLQNVREMRGWMAREVYLDLAGAPWDKASIDLVPGAGSCDACPKRTGFVPALFPEVDDKDTCTDPECFEAKKVAFVELRKVEVAAAEPETIVVSGEWRSGHEKSDLLDRSRYRELDEEEAADNPHAQKAFVADGDKAGKTSGIEPRRSTGFEKSEKDKAADKKAKLEEKIKAETMRRSVAAVVDTYGTTDLRWDEWRFIVSRMWQRAWNDLRRHIINRRKIAGATAADRVRAMDEWIATASAYDLVGLLAELAMGGHSEYSQEHVKELAAINGIDLEDIAAEVREELGGEKRKAKPAAKNHIPDVVPPKKAAAKKTPAKTSARKAAKKAAKKAPKKVAKKGGKK